MPVNKEVTGLADYIADELCAEEYRKEMLDEDFFSELDKALRRRGYRIRAEQKGIQGTVLTIIKIDD